MPNPNTLANGLRTSLGELTLPILRRHVTGFFAVGEEEIVQAMQFAYERLKLVIEPSSAVVIGSTAQARASTHRQAGRCGA
jgi:threonine dehydratase